MVLTLFDILVTYFQLSFTVYNFAFSAGVSQYLVSRSGTILKIRSLALGQCPTS
jgi:hypothetical protein